MTSDIPDADTQVPSELDPPSPPAVDWFLQALVGLVNHTGLEIGVTLSVGGTTISGQLIPAGRYRIGIGAELDAVEFGPKESPIESSPESPIKSMGDVVRLLLVHAYGTDEVLEDDPPDGPPRPDPVFLHLRGARIYLPGASAMPTNHGMFWRGRLTAIDGFTIGSLSESQGGGEYRDDDESEDEG